MTHSISRWTFRWLRATHRGWLLLALLAVGIPWSGHAANIAAGSDHVCAITPTGGVQCWGYDGGGQLGDGSGTPNISLVPVDVAGLNGPIVSLASGSSHTCALTAAGEVQCWGTNSSGQLGNGDISGTQQNSAVTVSGLSSGVAAISAGALGTFTCALTTAGALKCWGYNGTGQLGNGDNSGAPQYAPVPVSGLGSGVAAVSAADYYACAVTTGGAAKCWGYGIDGSLGDGDLSYHIAYTPVQVVGLTSGVAAISTGAGYASTCALSNTGAVSCWGDNQYGGLGNGDPLHTSQATPVPVTGLGSGVVAIFAGGSGGRTATCALGTALTLRCWGGDYGATAGAVLGNGYGYPRLTPTPVVGLSAKVVGLSIGSGFACALGQDGEVHCWGYAPSYGQLGDATQYYYPNGSGPYAKSTVPVPVLGLGSGVARIHSGGFFSCSESTTGAVQCWGQNYSGGTLGNSDASRSDQAAPSPVTALGTGVLAVATSTSASGHSCAITSSGAVKCWGAYALGDAVQTTNAVNPVQVSGITSGATAVAVGITHSCAVVSGGVKCWGTNTYGSLGNGDTTDHPIPVSVSGLGPGSGVTAIAAGDYHTCALIGVGGAVKCWGYNYYGQLGNSDSGGVNQNAPVDVTGLGSGVSAIAAGGSNTCAVTNTGAALCWGFNGNGGALGNGDNSGTPQYAPAQVSGLTSGVSAIATSGQHGCAIVSGAAKCWGYNYRGELGNGDNSLATQSAPVAVNGLGSGVAGIAAAAGENTCAVTTGGATYCWGDNTYGQLGIGHGPTVTFPVDPVPGTFAVPVVPVTTVSGLVQAPPLIPPATSGKAGSSIASAPGVVVVGAPDSDAGSATSGQVYVYTGSGLSPSAASSVQAGMLAKSLEATADVNLATLQLPGGLQINGDKFGGSVAVSHDGSTVVVGAPSNYNGTGAVYIFQEPLGGWGGNTVLPNQTIIPPAAQGGDQTGAAVVITNAGTIVVGAPGAVVSGILGAGKGYVLRKSGGSYAVAETLNASTPTPDAHFGSSISGEGSELAIGAPNQGVDNQTDRGAVQTFREQNGQFTLRDLLTDLLGQAGDKFGTSVSIHDGQLVVGSPGHDQPAAPDAGEAMMFEQTSTGTPAPTAVLVDPQADAGAALGSSVTLVVDRVIVGAPMEDVNGNTDQGAAAVYNTPPTGTFTGTVNPDGHLYDPLGLAGDQYGTSVSSDGGLSAVGSPNSGTVLARGIKAMTGVVAPGEAVAYTDSIIFRDDMESIRGASDACISPNTPIPDNNPTGITSDLLLNVTGDVRDVNVSVLISHSFVSDLRISLIHVPTGRTVPLYAPPPLPASQCPSANLNVEFDDQAVDGFARDQCGGGNPAIDGRFLPNDWLTIMQGVTRAGPWRLKVVDAVAGGTGTLQTWCVNSR